MKLEKNICIIFDPPSVLRRLLGHGIRVDVKDHDGREPLMWAASAGSTDAIVTLVNSGAGVSARDKARKKRSLTKIPIVYSIALTGFCLGCPANKQYCPSSAWH